MQQNYIDGFINNLSSDMAFHRFLKKESGQEKTTKKRTGFTLIEIIFAVAVFVIVVTAASTIFVQVIRGQRRNLAYQELLDQTSYVMEYMSRSIRMAMKDDIEIWGFPAPAPPGCLGGADKVNYEIINGSCLRFRDYENQRHEFCLVANKLVEIIDGGSPIDLTSASNLNVLPLPPNPSWVAITGEGQGDGRQPLVTILLQVEGREGTSIQIQTSISQRNLDIFK